MAKEGRPTVMTPETIEKLEEAFLNGASDKEAIFIASISSSTFYDYCKENPEFAERKEALKDMVKYQARKVVADAIHDGDKNTATWFLERKAKDEFSSRTEQTGANGAPLFAPSEAEKAKITKALESFGTGTGNTE